MASHFKSINPKVIIQILNYILHVIESILFSRQYLETQPHICFPRDINVKRRHEWIQAGNSHGRKQIPYTRAQARQPDCKHVSNAGVTKLGTREKFSETNAERISVYLVTAWSSCAVVETEVRHRKACDVRESSVSTDQKL